MLNDGENAFNQFIAKRKTDLQRIARATRNEYGLSDVQGEAWVMAHDMREVKGVPIEFLSPAYQDLLVSYLYQKLVRYTEQQIRHAVRLDHAPPDVGADEMHPLMRTLVSDSGRDPLALLIEQETSAQQDIEPDCHHSLAMAYVSLLRQFDNKMRAVADYLLISLSHCYRRCAKAHLLATHQQPIAMGHRDKNECRTKAWRRFRLHRPPVQLAFNFDDELPFST